MWTHILEIGHVVLSEVLGLVKHGVQVVFVLVVPRVDLVEDTLFAQVEPAFLGVGNRH